MENRFIQKRDSSIQLILKVGLELFAQNGFHQTTIRMIAEKAGISLGLLYNYFSSKEEVLKAIFQKTIQEIQAGLKEAVLDPDGRVLLTTFIRHFFRSLKYNKNFWQLYHSIRLSSSTALVITNEINDFTSSIQRILESCLVESEISFPGLEAKLLYAALDGLTHHYLLQENYPVDDLVNLLLMKYPHLSPK